jgi:hypothetical protein
LRGTLPAIKQIRQAGLTRDLIPRVLPALAITLSADGAGRAAGYALGMPVVESQLLTLEFGRHAFLRLQDRRAEAMRQPTSEVR